MDPILYWNDVALEANRVSHTNGAREQLGPTLSSRALAIVHLAMYDAFAGATGNPADLPPYRKGLPTPPAGASVDAAVAAAAYVTLSALFPSQAAFFDRKHSSAGLTGTGLGEGHMFGRTVGQRMLDARQADPNASDVGYVASLGRGRHRVDPDNPDPATPAEPRFHAPFYGARSRCFAATMRHALGAPPDVSTSLGSPYLRALRDVRATGIAPELMGSVPTGSRRTVDETLIGIYWAYDGPREIGTPPRLYNQIVREVALRTPNLNTGALNTPAQNARLFALVNAAMGDAGILAWEQKYRYDYWRPIVGIREHDPSLGPLGVANNNIANETDILWRPLGAPRSNAPSMAKNSTPNFPAYPSGHATFGAAAFHAARLCHGVPTGNRAADALFQGLSFVSDELNGVNRDNTGAVRPRHSRDFPSGLWQMIEENGRSRVFLGVHWVFDSFAVDNTGKPDLNQNLGGVPLGLTIAEDIFADGLNEENGAAPA